MRIAYIINSMEGGGAASPVPAITQVLRGGGADVRVFALTRRDGRSLPAMIAAGLDAQIRDGGEHDHFAAFRWLARETHSWGATHLWTSLSRATILGLLLSRWRALPVVCWQHNAFLKFGNRRLLRALQSQASLWVADSECVAALTAERLKVGPERLMTWPIFAADPSAPVAAPWKPGDPILMGSMGRLHTAKGYDVLITALAQLRSNGFKPPAPLHLTIAGEGVERARLEALAREVGVQNLAMPGFADRPQEFLAGLHLYVQPSRREGFCIAVHEAMTAGLPILASAVGEIAHSVQSGTNGHVVPPNDHQLLARRLHQLLANPGDLHRMGMAGRAHVLDHFSQPRFVAAGEAVLGRFTARQ